MVELHERFGMEGGGWLGNKNSVELKVTCGSVYFVFSIDLSKERFIEQILGHNF